MTSPFTRAADSDRLLEAVATEANLARALLSVVRNKGAPGIDGQTVEEAEAKAPRLPAFVVPRTADLAPNSMARVKPPKGQ